jgi:predicted metal-dependent hydrolase
MTDEGKRTDYKNRVAEGVRLFNEGRFFEAHEEWEKEWKCTAESAEKHFLQGMIMVAAALVHYTRGEPVGAAKLLQKGMDVLGAFREAPVPIDKEGFLHAVKVFYELFTMERELLSDRDFPKIKMYSENQGAS